MALVALVVLFFIQPLVRLMLHAAQNPLHSHIPLVPLIAGYLLYVQRRPRVAGYRTSIGGAMSLVSIGVAALAAVNAVGDVCEPETGKNVAGNREDPKSRKFANTAALMKKCLQGGFLRNTTLVVVATNARLSKVGCTKLAQLASLGVARAINPVWTMSDGDVVIALSLGAEEAPVDALGVAAAEAVSNAIIRSVRLATSMGGVPGLV